MSSAPSVSAWWMISEEPMFALSSTGTPRASIACL